MGVKAASVDFPTAKATVVTDGNVTGDQLLEALKKVGYGDASLISKEKPQ